MTPALASIPVGWAILGCMLALMGRGYTATTEPGPKSGTPANEPPASAPASAPAPITALVFTRDGSHLVSNGNRSLIFRSPHDGRPERSVPCPLAKISSVATHPNSPQLIVAGGKPGVRGALLVGTGSNGTAMTEIPLGTDLITSVALSSSGQLLAAACTDHSAFLLPWKNGAPDTQATLKLTGHSGPVLAIAFLDAGDLVLTASADRSLKLWKSRTGELVRTLQYHTEAIHSIAVRPSRETEPFESILCATAGEDRTLRVWQPAIGRMVRIVRGHGGPVFAVVWDRDGKSLFSAGKEGVLRRIDGRSDTILSQWKGHSDWIYCLALHPDGSSVATGDWAGEVRIQRVDPLP